MAAARERYEETDDEPRLSFLEWTKEHRYIRDKESGQIRLFSLRDYPWLEHLYNAIGNLEYEGRMVIRKAAQIGATELALNFTFWMLDGRGSVFYALPPGPTQSNFAHARVNPAITASPHIKEMAGNIDNVGLKTFANGFNLYIRGTNVPQGNPQKAAQLSEAPADLAIVDEFDRVPPAAIPLIRDRLGDSRDKWEIDLSTPTYPDIGIDHEYHDTQQWEPRVKCDHCNVWHWLDWSLVRGPVADDHHARIVCPLCRRKIKREGMWIERRIKWEARHPEREVIGYWIPKLVSERTNLDALWKRSKAKKEIDIQAFWNGDVGVAYEPKGARLTRELISACAAGPAVYPTFQDTATWTAMGVDVGFELHYWIKERHGGRQRTVAIGTVLNWEDLDVLMVRYGVQRCVVDDGPELTADVKFQKRHPGKVWLAQYVDNENAELAVWVKGRGIVKIERTKGLAEASANIQLCIDELPANWETVEDLLEHLTASLKVKRVKDDGSTVYHFPHTGKPDHFHHAKVYVDMAMAILPPDPGTQEKKPDRGSVPGSGGKGHYIPGSMRGRL